MSTGQAMKKGFIWGILATLIMTLVMVIGMSTDIAPMPEPIPIAIVKFFLGDLANNILMTIGMIAHFGYGAVAGAIFMLLLGEQINVFKGLVWGVILWILMQIWVLPLIGWGLFGIRVTGMPPKIAMGTLVLHLLYGGFLGWGGSRTI